VGGSSRPPSPKRARTDFHGSNNEETSAGLVQGSQTKYVKQVTNFETIPENEPVEQEFESDITIGDELLIETMHREHEDSAQVPPNKWLTPCPILNTSSISHETCKLSQVED
jgi:hypothetical protein